MAKSSLFTFALWLIYACAFVYTQEASQSAEADALVAKADNAIKGSPPNYEEALSSYSAAIKLDPTNFNTYYKRAGVYLLRGKNKPALDDLNKVVANNPGFVQARLRRGKVNLALGNLEDAKTDYSEVLKVKPDNDLAKTQLAALEKCSRDLQLGRELVEKGQYEDANRILTELLDVASDNAEARLLRAQVSIQLKQYHRILEDTMAVLKQSSRNVEALYYRGRGFYYLGEREAAMKHYMEGLKYDPEHTKCKAEFKRLNKLEKAMKAGEEKFGQNSIQEALEDFETAISLEPDNQFVTPGLYLSKCRCHLKLKEVVKTLDSCSKAIELDDSLVDAYINRAEAQMLAEDYDKAIHEWNKAREKQPQNQQINEGIHRAQRLQKMASRKDYYKILEVLKTASDAEIRKSYRRLALIWHPDKHPDGEAKVVAEKKYVEIAEAYEILSNAETRTKFDNGEDLNPQAGGGGGGFPFGHGFPGGGGGGGPFTFHFNFGGR